MAIKYIVTGGAGFIGSNLVEALVLSGCEVVVIDNLTAGKKEHIHPQASFRQLDICESPTALEHAFGGADGVFHLAALPRVPRSFECPVETMEVNLIGTQKVLEATRKAGVRRLVFASSSSVYGNQTELPLREVMTPEPLSPYAIQKLAGEHLCRIWSRVYQLQTVSLRFFNVYGPRLDPSGPYALVIGKFLRQRQAGERLTICGDGEQTRDFTHVSDVVRACMLAMSSEAVGAGESINIGAGNPVSVNRIAELIGGEVEYLPPRPGEPRHTKASTAYARSFLDWSPSVTIEQGIEALKEHLGLY